MGQSIRHCRGEYGVYRAYRVYCRGWPEDSPEGIQWGDLGSGDEQIPSRTVQVSVLGGDCWNHISVHATDCKSIVVEFYFISFLFLS